MPQLIHNLTIRLSEEELSDLQHLGALQQAPVSSVVRAMIRDYLIGWRKEGRLALQLGIVNWEAPDK